MISPEYQKILEELGKTHYGAAVRNYLQLEIDDLSNILNATSWDDTLGRQHSVKILERIQVFLGGTPKPLSRGKNQYD